MSIELFVNATRDPIRNYVSWAPSRCLIRTDDSTPRTVTLSNGDTTRGGQLEFMLDPAGPGSDSLQIDLPPANGFVQFYVAGKFNRNTGEHFASTEDGDASVQIVDDADNSTLMTQPMMVRVRKNANALTESERDRFLSALVVLNQNGDFVDFQNVHINDTSLEIHGRSCFLPWHRLYLLDLERKLQRIDPSVSLPYWRFDQAAPDVFARDFMGEADATGLVQFSSTNPMVNWRLTIFGGSSGRIRRTPLFDTATEPANIENNEMQTLNLGTSDSRTNFQNFERMEEDPHGSAHVSFNGQVSSIGQAPADPLFFMLHCNVDRLWAKWQWMRSMYDPSDVNAYYKQGRGPINSDTMREGADNVGNYARDTLWPWNGHRGEPRPRSAPGTYFPTSFLPAPSRYPELQDAMDFQGQLDIERNIGFSYDDVPYDFD